MKSCMRISSIRMNTNSAIISSLSGHRAGSAHQSSVKKSVFANICPARPVRREGGSRWTDWGLTEDHHDSQSWRYGGAWRTFPREAGGQDGPVSTGACRPVTLLLCLTLCYSVLLCDHHSYFNSQYYFRSVRSHCAVWLSQMLRGNPSPSSRSSILSNN